MLKCSGITQAISKGVVNKRVGHMTHVIFFMVLLPGNVLRRKLKPYKSFQLYRSMVIMVLRYSVRFSWQNSLTCSRNSNRVVSFPKVTLHSIKLHSLGLVGGITKLNLRIMESV